MGERIFRIIIGLLIIAIACTASYYFYELTPLHEAGESLNKSISIVGKIVFGGAGLASCLFLLYLLLKFAEYVGSFVWQK